MDWLNLARDRKECCEIYLLSEQLSDSQHELWSVELVQHVERIKTVQSNPWLCVCVCVSARNAHIRCHRNIKCHSVSTEHFLPLVLVPRTVLGAHPPSSTMDTVGRAEKRPRREAHQRQNL